MRGIVSVLTLVLVPSMVAAQTGGITVDKEKKAVIIDCKVAPRKLADPKFEGMIYPVEVVASWGYPKGQKSHETVLTFEVKPSEVHKALESLGLKAGKPSGGTEAELSTGPELKLSVEVPTEGGDTRKVPIERTLVDPRTGKPLPAGVKWRFTGSIMTKVSPDKDDLVYGADESGTLISIFPVTNKTVIQTSLTMKEEKFLKIETNEKVLPKVGTPVKLIIEVAK